ncbi:MAG TPA: tRNA (guanosine(37)-N1)-methyltransferase TrmD [Candidatus Saccharimonadales bacterium]|nr:tRNA (guanosine(37)-N1)-methyltransferase TrmD [Candidatus Saccharimonadales bacterium]
MKFDVLTIFPEMIEQGLSWSIPSRAQKAGAIEVKAYQLRDYGVDKHGNVDDSPYGGGPGMILRVDVADKALEAADPGHRAHRIMFSPDGEILSQKLVKELAAKDHLVLLSGRYEGFDARIEPLVDQKISIGSYVLSGGELPALVIIDAIARLLPGVLGNEESLKHETFENDVTDFPQYTRPDNYNGQSVPEVLKNGHHAEIEKWRQSQQKPVDAK